MCELSKNITETKTHYIGKSGELYDVNHFGTWGDGKRHNGKDDLPLNDYPYKIKYKEEYSFLCCRNCGCKDKFKLNE